jgi:hypothetical protein
MKPIALGALALMFGLALEFFVEGIKNIGIDTADRRGQGRYRRLLFSTA